MKTDRPAKAKASTESKFYLKDGAERDFSGEKQPQSWLSEGWGCPAPFIQFRFPLFSCSLLPDPAYVTSDQKMGLELEKSKGENGAAQGYRQEGSSPGAFINNTYSSLPGGAIPWRQVTLASGVGGGGRALEVLASCFLFFQPPSSRSDPVITYTDCLFAPPLQEESNKININ